MNNFVESNQKDIACRPNMGVDLLFGCNKGNDPELIDPSPGQVSAYTYREKSQEDRERTHIDISFGDEFEETICQKVSAIAIRKLSCKFGRGVRMAEEEKLLRVFRRLRPSCDSAEIFGISLAGLIEMADLIDCRGMISFQMRHRQFSYANFVTLVSALRTNLNSSKFKVCINDFEECPVDGLLEMLKPFKAGYLHRCTEEGFRQFFLDIVNSPDVGNLERLTCRFPDSEDSWPFEDREVPPFSFVWDLDNHPFFDGNDIGDFVAGTPLSDWEYPTCIRLMQLTKLEGTKFAVIVDCQPGGYCSQDIIFVNTMADVANVWMAFNIELFSDSV